MAPATAVSGGSVHVEPCMGTVFSIDIRDPGSWDDALHDVVAWLHHVDRIFSTYRPDSDISRIRGGELAVADADPNVAVVLNHCARLQRETGGYFSALCDGALDPTGLVKGWAIEQASGLLRSHGSRNHTVNGGGDVQAAGEAAPGRAWNVGICDPLDRSHVLRVVTGRDFAVATSGSSERGAHITNPFTAGPPDGLASVTVVGTSLTRVDAYATAAFAMGRHAASWLETCPDHEAVVVFDDGAVHTSSGLPRQMRSLEPAR